MHTIAALLADFILEEKAYVNANLDEKAAEKYRRLQRRKGLKSY